MKKIKIICTLGPASYKKKILTNLKKLKVDILRINLSHTKINDIKKKILYLKKNKVKNICIDTEGAQVRITNVKKSFNLKKGKIIKLYNDNKTSNKKEIFLQPNFNLENLKIGTKLYIGFNNLCMRIIDNSDRNFLKCKVIVSGFVESCKGVHINQNINLPPLSPKDIYALKLAKNLKINNFAISFVNSHLDIIKVKKIIGNKSFIISKIETKNALKNLKKISKNSSALLIDRGDLSRYIPIEEIPIIQDLIIKETKKENKPTYVATNLLETMIKESLPTRAESHDIYSTLKQGALGLVLAAETAIGKNPLDSVNFLKKCINAYYKKRISNLKSIK